jgi:hypothetical protein
VALLLDAQIAPQSKLELAPALFTAVNTGQPRNTLRAAFAQYRGQFAGAEGIAYDRLAERSDATVIDAVAGAFHDAFLIAGLLAVLAAVAVGPPHVWRTGLAIGAASLAVGAPAAYAAIDHQVTPAQVRILKPCQPRAPPGTNGLTGFLQDRALQALDVVACRLHTTREVLVLAFAGDPQAQRALGPAARPGLNLMSLLGLAM